MDRGLLGLAWVACAGVAFAVALLHAFVVPLASGTHGFEHVVLRWFHALVSALLGLSALMRGCSNDATTLADAVAGTALALHVLPVVTLAQARRRSADRPA